MWWVGLLYRSRLVPRILPSLALAGAPLLLTNDIGIFFGFFGASAKRSALDGLAAIPVAVHEFAFRAYLVVKGFRPDSP